MKIYTYTVGPFAENTYLVVNGQQAILIDPGFSTHSEFAFLRDDLKEKEAELEAILLTHAHIDHVLGLNQVLQAWETPVYLNHSDLQLWENIESQSARFGIASSGFSFTPEPLVEQQGLELAGMKMDVLYTPGHSPDHVSLWFSESGVVFGGDALFRESIGRTDLYRGDFELLASSIRDKLYTLPEETRVLSGHGSETTIGHEKINNPFVNLTAGR